MGLGRVYPSDPNEPFCMTVLALEALAARQRRQRPARHGLPADVAAALPQRAEQEVPIGHITNGVHVQSWVAPQMHLLFDRHLGTDWPSQPAPPRDLGGDRHRRGRRTVGDPAGAQGEDDQLRPQPAGGAGPSPQRARRRHRAVDGGIDLEALTIGFARRFATYKRAGLVLQDVERLIEMVRSSDRPIQFVFAGKAHPEDRMGKELIQQIARLTRDDRFATRIVFVEDYDMNVGRTLVQGVDIWLNNPRRPQEASGTSRPEGGTQRGLNCSILDGWWAEAYDGTNGFAIGAGRTHANPSVQDQRDHRDLIATLTEQVVPLYYKRDASGLPRGWIARQKDAFRTLAWRFNADRMVMDYVQRLPARRWRCLLCDGPSMIEIVEPYLRQTWLLTTEVVHKTSSAAVAKLEKPAGGKDGFSQVPEEDATRRAAGTKSRLAGQSLRTPVLARKVAGIPPRTPLVGRLEGLASASSRGRYCPEMADPILHDATWERMILAVEKVRQRLLRATAALEKAGVPYAVAGGNAVAAWVSRVDEAAVRNTQDVDLLLRRVDLHPRGRRAGRGRFRRAPRCAGVQMFLDGPKAKARDAVYVVFAGEKVRREYALAAPDVAESESTPTSARWPWSRWCG